MERHSTGNEHNFSPIAGEDWPNDRVTVVSIEAGQDWSGSTKELHLRNGKRGFSTGFIKFCIQVSVWVFLTGLENTLAM